MHTLFGIIEPAALIKYFSLKEVFPGSMYFLQEVLGTEEREAKNKGYQNLLKSSHQIRSVQVVQDPKMPTHQALLPL